MSANLVDWEGHSTRVEESQRQGSVRLFSRTAQVLPQNSVWLLSEATFGTSRFNPLSLELPGLADIQGRFYYHHRSFWIESLADNAAVQLNDRIIAPGEIIPLVTGQSLKLGSAIFSVGVSA